MNDKVHKISKRLAENNFFIYCLLYPAILLRRQFQEIKNSKFEKFYNSIFEMVEEGSLVVKMPDFMGSYEIDHRSHILRRILKTKKYEPELVDLIQTHVNKEKDVIDIGANIGLYTVFLSKKILNTSKVLSIEPTPLALEYLYRNLERNKVKDSVIVFEGIASDSKGKFHINVIEGMEEYSSLGNLVHTSIKEKFYKKIEVKGDTIDNLIERFKINPGFMKVDTEGAEYSVFCGAINTIQTYKPVILSELSDLQLSNFGVTSDMVIKLLQNNGYHVIDANHYNISFKTPFDGEILALPK